MMDQQAKVGGKKYLLLHSSDNTATALVDLERGETLYLGGEGGSREVTLRDPIPFAHKFAVLPISRGGEVRKYGEPIGEASQDISAGDHVHIHNVASERARGKADEDNE